MLRRHRAMLLCGVAAFFAYAYFYEAGGWNQNTRFDLVRALVEHRSIQIDEYQENSGDKAAFEGHYYADKAPGASFTAAPAVALARAAMRLVHANPRSHANLTWQSYVASLAAAALPGALAVMCVWRLARRLGANETGATVIALAFGLGTPFWAWATVFYSHALAAACLLGAFLAALNLGEPPVRAGRDVRLGLAIGGLIGWAVLTEFPTAVPGAIVGLFAMGQVWRGGLARVSRLVLAVALAGGLCAVLLGAYHQSAFGSPFHVGYASEQDTTVLSRGFFGFTYPKADILGELLWGSFRGLLPLAPVLVLVPIGWAMLLRSPSRRAAGLVAAATFLAGLALMSAYEHWEGGWSFGPRQLGSVVGFAALGLVPVWIEGGRWLRAVVVTLALAGAGLCLVGVSTTAQPPAPEPQAPMREVLWPAFRDGQLSLNRQSYFDIRPPGEAQGLRDRGVARAQWNLGEKMGLSGLASLLPLLLGLGLFVSLAIRTED
jgi:hypothetical protein